MTFKDLFSGHAEQYSQHRPTYPPELFEYLASVSKPNEAAWDCATGNGQAAIGLTPYFNTIYATDASEKQIAHAFPHPKVKYSVALAENSGLPGKSVNLTTLATAIHWVDIEKFSEEVKRVTKPGGIIAVWNYTRIIIGNDITSILDDYYQRILGSYWDPKLLRLLYDESLYELPFKRLETPDIKMKSRWNFQQVINYLKTWSAAQKYIKDNNSDPLDIIFNSLKKAWGNTEEVKEINWQYFLRVYKIS